MSLKCANHPDREGRFVCEQCGRVWCEDCIVVKTFEAKPIEMCPACGAMVSPLTTKSKTKTKRQTAEHTAVGPAPTSEGIDFESIMADWSFPADLEALGMMFLLGAFIAISYAAASMLIPGLYLFMLMPVSVFAMNLFAAAKLATEEEESYKDPLGNGPLFSNMLMALLKLIAASLWPLITWALAAYLFIQLGHKPNEIFSRQFLFSPASWTALILSAILLPGPFVELAKSDNIFAALNPWTSIRYYIQAGSASLIGIFVFLMDMSFVYLIVLLSAFILPQIDNLFFVHGIVLMLFVVLAEYVLMAFARTAGRLAVETTPTTTTIEDEESIPTEPTYPPEQTGVGPIPDSRITQVPQPEVQARPRSITVEGYDPSMISLDEGADLGAFAEEFPPEYFEDFGKIPEAAQLLEKARSIQNGGSLAEAEQVYRQLLMKFEYYLEGLLGYYELLYGMQRYAEAEEVGKRLLEIARARKMKSLAVRIWKETKMQNPKIRFKPETNFFVAESLEEMGEYQEAASLFRDMAKEAPEHNLAPRAIFRCAEVLTVKMNRPDLGKKIFMFLTERYPNSSEADEAVRRLSSMGM